MLYLSDGDVGAERDEGNVLEEEGWMKIKEEEINSSRTYDQIELTDRPKRMKKVKMVHVWESKPAAKNHDVLRRSHSAKENAEQASGSFRVEARYAPASQTRSRQQNDRGGKVRKQKQAVESKREISVTPDPPNMGNLQKIFLVKANKIESIDFESQSMDNFVSFKLEHKTPPSSPQHEDMPTKGGKGTQSELLEGATERISNKRSTMKTDLVSELISRNYDTTVLTDYPPLKSDYFSYYFETSNPSMPLEKTQNLDPGVNDKEWKELAKSSKYAEKSVKAWELAGEEFVEKMAKFMLKLVAFRRCGEN